MIIGIDIDDTLTYLKDSKIESATNFIKNNNLPYQLIDPDAIFFKDMFDWPEEVCNQFWYAEADKLLSSVPARDNASEVVSRLKNAGHKIIIITARTTEWHKQPYQMSFDWLQKNNIPFDKLIVGHTDKTQVCVDENIDVFIDDLPSTLVKLQNENIKTILVVNPTNKNQDVYCGPASPNWLEIEKILEKI